MAPLPFAMVHLTVLNRSGSALSQFLPPSEPLLPVTVGLEAHSKLMPPSPRAPSVVLSVKRYLMMVE